MEILRVMRTTGKNTIQIITFDHQNSAYRIITWDIENKYESTILEKISTYEKTDARSNTYEF